jgi:Lrp/AsnC family transcriptional regulator, regulator for asnA, asnC and gidA
MQQTREARSKKRNSSEIDQTDAKILQILLRESRTSFTDIAKQCDVSVGAVRMRFARLKKIGIITGETMQISPHSLGYHYVSDLGIKTSVDQEASVLKFLQSKPYLSHNSGSFGVYNFWTKVVLHDIQELTGILEDLESNPAITRVDTFTWVEDVNVDHVENLTFTPQLTMQPVKARFSNGGSFETKDIDEKDRRIVKALTENSRLPFRRIAGQLGISTKNVIQRYNRLRGTVLTRSTITVDLNKLGYKAWAHLLIKSSNRSRTSEICAKLLQVPNLIVIIRYIGVYDLYATIALVDFEAFFKCKEQIRKIEGVEQTEYFLGPIYPKWPLNLFPFLLERKN